MDYDLTSIPAGYDRGRALDPQVLELWMDAVQSQVEAGVARVRRYAEARDEAVVEPIDLLVFR